MIVLNGASSSGKTSIARALQEVLLPEAWLTFGVDSLIEAMPPSLGDEGEGLDLHSDGSIAVGAGFQRLQDVWLEGLAAMVRAGARIVFDEVFLGGAESQARRRAVFAGIDVLWVGVHCSPTEAARRELARGDRVVGQAAQQAAIVHVGVAYDLEVDTTETDARTCAEVIAAHRSG